MIIDLIFKQLKLFFTLGLLNTNLKAKKIRRKVRNLNH